MIKDLSSSILSITTITDGFNLSSSVLLLNCDEEKASFFHLRSYLELRTGVRAETLCLIFHKQF